MPKKNKLKIVHDSQYIKKMVGENNYSGYGRSINFWYWNCELVPLEYLRIRATKYATLRQLR